MASTKLPRLSFVASVAILIALSTGSRLTAQVRFELRGEGSAAGEPIQAGLNQDVKVGVYIVSSAGAGAPAIQGFQMAISHDPAFLDFVSATWKGTALDAATLRNSLGPER